MQSLSGVGAQILAGFPHCPSPIAAVNGEEAEAEEVQFGKMVAEAESLAGVRLRLLPPTELLPSSTATTTSGITAAAPQARDNDDDDTATSEIQPQREGEGEQVAGLLPTIEEQLQVCSGC